jgi:hypothetical protein
LAVVVVHDFYVAIMLHGAPRQAKHGRSKPVRAQVAKERDKYTIKSLAGFGLSNRFPKNPNLRAILHATPSNRPPQRTFASAPCPHIECPQSRRATRSRPYAASSGA